MATIETLHNKYLTKFNALEDLAKYLKKVDKKYDSWCEEFGHVKDTSKKSSKSSATPKSTKVSYSQWISDMVNSNSGEDNKMDKILMDVTTLFSSYTTQTTPILTEYYESQHENENFAQAKGDKNSTNEVFKRIVTSENYIDRMDSLLKEMSEYNLSAHNTKLFKKFIKQNELIGLGSFSKFGSIEKPKSSKKEKQSSKRKNSEFSKLGYYDTIIKFVHHYEQIKISIVYKKQDTNVCYKCGKQMIIYANESERRCNNCNLIIKLQGAIFDDSQAYTQQGQCTKHKEYDSNKHCSKWIAWLQAKGKNIIPDSVIDKVDAKAVKEYTRFGNLHSMEGIKCQQIRKWLKDLRLTKWNHHAPLIRKLVTSRHGKGIIPPQMTPEEEQEVLIEFSQDMDKFEDIIKNRPEIVEEIFKKTRSNRPYYPYGLWHVLVKKFRNDPRLKGLLECVHLQSDSTLKKHDRMREFICKERKIPYEPTNRTLIDELYY